MVKKGDTLIEVTLAVGIFSMIAIAIASVMSSGTSNAQTALETTLAREEIDAQAEALRFIQSSYVANKDGSVNRFVTLWDEITKNAIGLDDTEKSKKILQYAPSSCSELYGNSDDSIINDQNAFILNTRALGTFESNTVSSVYISADKNKAKFSEASTYPHLIFSDSEDGSNSNDDNLLIEQGASKNLYRAEGIYIVAVKDQETTKIVAGQDKNAEAQKKAAFYDFFIRTCWYGANADTPSTISTVIRLYDPQAIDQQKRD